MPRFSHADLLLGNGRDAIDVTVHTGVVDSLVGDLARRGRGRLTAALGLYWGLPGWWLRLLIVGYVALNRLLGVQRESIVVIKSISDLDYFALFQIAATLVVGFAIIVRPFRMWAVVRRQLLTMPMLWIVLYFVLAMVSTFWSTAPLVTLFKSTQCIVFLIAIAAATEGLGTLRCRAAFACVLALVYTTVSYFTYFMWEVPEHGVNVESLHLVVSAPPFLPLIFLAGLSGMRRFGQTFTIIMFSAMVIETGLTDILGMCFAMSVLLYLHLTGRERIVIPLMAGLAVVVFLATIPGDPNAKVLGFKAAGDVVSGTGRFAVWQYALTEAFPTAPFFGQGFVVGDAVGRESGINAMLGQLHNSHLSALLNLGFAGAALWLAFLVSILDALLRIRIRRNLILLSCATALIGVEQLAGGASLSSMLHVVWIAHAFIFITIANESRSRGLLSEQEAIVATAAAGRSH